MKRRAGIVAAVLVGALACSDDKEPVAPEATPSTSLADMIANAPAGGLVRILADTTEVPATLVIAASQTGLRIQGRDITSARGDDPRPVLRATTGPDGDVFSVDADDVTISGVKIIGSYRNGVHIDADDVTVSDSRIESPELDCVSFAPAAGGLVLRCLLLDPGYFGVDIAPSQRSIRVSSNTIVGAGDCGIRSFGTPDVLRNIIVGSQNFGVFCGTAGMTFDCNDVYDNVTADYNAVCDERPTDISSEPFFCEPFSYALQTISPCLAGNTEECGTMGAVYEVCAPN